MKYRWSVLGLAFGDRRGVLMTARVGLLATCLAIFCGSVFAQDESELVPAITNAAFFRVMLDLDGPLQGATGFGGDRMIEGFNIYDYDGEKPGDWKWKINIPAIIVTLDNTLIYQLPGFVPERPVRWYAETTDPEWNVIDHIPLVDAEIFDYAELPVFSMENLPHPQAVDMSELLRYRPPALSVDFADDLRQREWKFLSVSNRPPLSWQPFSGSPELPLMLRLTDVVTGRRMKLVPIAAYISDETERWSGRTLGVDWEVLCDRDSSGNVTITGQLCDNEERCLRIDVGCDGELTGWTWHDDVRFCRPIQDGDDRYCYTYACEYGALGEESRYPLGVISRSDQGALIVETDLSEPRVCQIAAVPDESFFGVSYDLALTPQTVKFPGCATFRCNFRASKHGGAEAFRYALRDFYGRHPGMSENRLPTAGLWMPFSDISKIESPSDFGFAFFEKGGARGQDVDYCATNDILTLIYTEPWLYWLPMPAGSEWTNAAALHQMKRLAFAGTNQANEFAASALLGASRLPDQTRRMTFTKVPWNSGARMEVSVDPELEPIEGASINRAMSEWTFIKNALKDKRVDGIYLDSMSAMQQIDYNPVAMAVADYPCTYEAGVLKPGLSMEVAAFEFTAALGNYLREREKYLMGNFPCWRAPFFMPYIDIPGEESCWYTAGVYAPPDEKDLNHRRAMSGGKPFGFLQAAHFDEIESFALEYYFRDCLFWAFQPSFFSFDGTNKPYWENPEWLNRDRHYFKTYVPLCQRLSQAGWQPVADVVADDPALWIEQFGRTSDPVWHFTFRNTQNSPLKTSLMFPDNKSELIVVDPLNGAIAVVSGDETIAVELPVGGIGVRDVVSVSSIASEIDFLRNWNSGNGENQKCLRSLESLQRERSAGVAHIAFP